MYNKVIMKKIILITFSLVIIFGMHLILIKTNISYAYNINSGNNILNIGKNMIDNNEIIKGSCWNFIDTVYKRAGYNTNNRVTIFKETKNGGKYADVDIIMPGDWLYYINYSYNMIEHSGIFVKWVDKKKKIARILGYAGENRNLPGRYRDHDLRSVYNIIRPINNGTNISTQKNINGKICPSNLILNQNIKAPDEGKPYIRNGKYHWYTKNVVKEADILQKHLNRLGFNAGPVDGIIGPKTKSAILRLQKYLGTIADGYVGPKTRKLLNNSCN